MAESKNSKMSYAKWYKILGQICEVASVMLFAWGVLWLYFNLYSGQESKEQQNLPLWLLPVIILLAAVIAFVAAVKLSVVVAEEDERLASRIKYKVTPRRIETLREAKVRKDVLHYLKKIISDDLMPEEEFLAKLESELGTERTNEVKAVILKYTRVYDKTDPKDEPPPPTSTAALPNQAQQIPNT